MLKIVIRKDFSAAIEHFNKNGHAWLQPQKLAVRLLAAKQLNTRNEFERSFLYYNPLKLKTDQSQMKHLRINRPIDLPNLMFFHNQWLDKEFTTVIGTVILRLRPTEKSNLKRLMAQTMNLERCVAKFGDLVQMLLKVGVTNFAQPKLEDIKSWHQLLVYIIAIIGKYQGWDPNLIAAASEIKPK